MSLAQVRDELGSMGWEEFRVSWKRAQGRDD